MTVLAILLLYKASRGVSH